MFVFFDLYCVYVCIFVIYIEYFPYCLFISNSQVIGCENRLRNDLYCSAVLRWLEAPGHILAGAPAPPFSSSVIYVNYNYNENSKIT